MFHCLLQYVNENGLHKYSKLDPSAVLCRPTARHDLYIKILNVWQENHLHCLLPSVWYHSYRSYSELKSPVMEGSTLGSVQAYSWVMNEAIKVCYETI